MTRNFPLWALFTLGACATTSPTPTTTTAQPEDCTGAVCTRHGTHFYSDAANQDRPRAYKLFVRACTQDDGPGCTAQGRMARDGFDTLPPQEIAQLFAKACELGHVAGCVESADLIRKTNPQDAFKMYENACANGSKIACVDQARLLGHAGRDAAVKILRPICREGREAIHATACFAWSRIEDDNAGASLATRACDIGLPEACLDLARRMRDARGVPADPTKSAAFFLSLCQAGIAPACADLASMNRDGVGVSASPSRAASLWRLACEGRELDACGHLGNAYLQALGVPKSPAAAIDLMTMACDAGHKPWCDEAATARQAHTQRSISKIGIQTVIRQNIPNIQKCTSHAPGASGRINVTFHLTAEGTVSPESTLEPTPEAQALVPCVERLVRKMRFPKPPTGSMKFRYPLRFDADNL